MKLDFLKDHYPLFQIDVFSKGEDEWAVIRHPETDAEIRIYYTIDDFQPFIFCFECQHIHINTENELLDYINEYISGRVAAIEFFKGERQGFGGNIETEIIANRDYEVLSKRFGYSYNILKDYRFVLNAWDTSMNCSGHFEKDSNGKAMIILD